MNLDSTTKVLRIVLGEVKTTNDCDVTTAWAESGLGNFTLGNTNIKSNGTTPVVVVAAPANSLQRQVKEVRLFNNDTVSHTVILQLYDGTNTWVISPSDLTVPPNGAFIYTPDSTALTGGTVTVVTSSGGSTGLTLTTANGTSTPALTLGGTLAIGSGGTGQTTASAALVALGATTGSGTVTATGSGTTGAATLNQGSGVVTSQALTAATTYALTLTNSRILATSTILLTLSNSAGLVTWPVTIVCSAGSAVITMGMAALTGTVVIAFAVVN
jgi:hypothetical protein